MATIKRESQTMKAKKKHVTKPHWYFVSSNECPACGRCDTVRERRYTKRPKNAKDRREFTMDGCVSGPCVFF